MARDWPALVIGLILLAYWGRVLRMAYKARRKRGVLGANFIPGESTGRVLRVIWNPVVALWIALPLVAFFAPGGRGLMRPFWTAPILSWVALGVAALAFGATWLCWKRMGKSWRMGIDPDEKTQLVVTGPYAYVRHPIYALSSVLMIATWVIVPTALMGIVAVAHLLLLQWEARREERHLAALHGPVYLDYASRTGRFVPIRGNPYRASDQPA